MSVIGARPVPKNSDSTLEMKVANMTFMLERLAQDCAPMQFVRELTQNAIDSIKQHGQGGEVRWDVDWTRFDLEPKDGYKMAVIDTGIGMTGKEMVDYINQLSSSMHQQSWRPSWARSRSASLAIGASKRSNAFGRTTR